MSLLASLARGAEIPVFAAIGAGGLAPVETLRRRPGLRLVDTPRHARVLLVAGEVDAAHATALERLHAQLARPRATVWWRAPRLFDRGEIADGDDPTGAIRRAAETDEPDQRPDLPPHPWEGIGPHGQGGMGMMGGTPYGRPMAMTAEDIRDGLALDAYRARFGPFLPMLPPGLALDLTLQGDVIVAAGVAAPPYPQGAESDAPGPCAARMLRLMGIGPRAARARGALAALPRGSGMRRRLAAWVDGARVDETPRPLPDALPGRDWTGAALWLASFAPSRLRAACLKPEAA
ncbi:hypothetical protein E2L08_12400 [Palleronia sediminis]|uniref:Uncharacterized protein n=1 Tax=Palleronia sediminis TaxID=2547833 RepID=A0A4R6A5W7_9RHOB|nr:hypothetical protein [Palleronia sediminis]TDL78094.1 hypothetical protein E2L08_12400 [Palleronia sediminis]